MKYIKWVILIIAMSGFFIYRELYLGSALESGVKDGFTFFEISPQKHFNDIIADLKQKNLIKNETLTTWYARITGLDRKIRAGRFKLDSRLSSIRILQFLSHPENGEMSVTIPEGFSIFDIDKKLVLLELIEKGEFTTWASGKEGYLFPDTYNIFANTFRVEDLGNAMAKNFQKKVTKGLEKEFRETIRTPAEIIKMASILEKEVRTKEDNGIVAGILWKRLDNGWPLQADATLLYGKKTRTISGQDLRDDGEYNSYTRLGLPLTPICNPGLKAIEGALNPVETPYWFYLTDSQGRTIYAKTNQEQEQNKRIYFPVK